MSYINNYADFLVQKYGKEAQWVNWRKEVVDGKETKVPYYSKNNRASSVNPDDWKTYEECAMALDNGSNEFSGIGIILHDEKLLCIDIDHVLIDGKLESPHKLIVEALLDKADTFTEVSQSGTGLHLFFELEEPYTPVRNKIEPFEVYTKGRYIATTGNSYHETPKDVRTVTVEEMKELLKVIGFPIEKQSSAKSRSNSVLQQLLHTDLEDTDQEIIDKMFSSKNGEKIKALYNGDISSYDNDDSSADLALLSHLAFWTGKDYFQMQDIWINSPLGNREKVKNRKDYRDRTIAKAIETCFDVLDRCLSLDVGDGECKDSLKKGSQADQLLKMVMERDDVILFKDERDMSYISLNINGHRESLKCGSSNVKDLLSYEFYKKHKKTIGAEVIKSVISVLEGKAKYTGERIKLENRVAFRDGKLWCDLTNKDWQAVKITDESWSVVSDPPILFKRFSHQDQQVLPAVNGNAELLLKYFNVKNQEHKLLLMVYLISCFIPDFPHPALVVFGSQGSAKSTLSKLLRRIIDPSLLEVVNLPKEQKELIQKLDHHYFTFFDNVSFISEETSDSFCKAITGSGFSKRVLYTDDDDMIYNFMRCIGINGISVVATRPDLLERSLVVELDRIEESERKQERDIYEDFNENLPFIMGGIFDVLVKTLKIKPTIKLDKLPRMADFMVWGCAITEALGYNKEDFINAYNRNINDQTKIALNDNSVALAILLLMKNREEWSGTATQLLSELNRQDTWMDGYGTNFPKAANILTRRLNEIKVNLKSIGIVYESSNTGDERIITLKKVDELSADGTDGYF